MLGFTIHIFKLFLINMNRICLPLGTLAYKKLWQLKYSFKLVSGTFVHDVFVWEIMFYIIFHHQTRQRHSGNIIFEWILMKFVVRAGKRFTGYIWAFSTNDGKKFISLFYLKWGRYFCAMKFERWGRKFPRPMLRYCSSIYM